MRSVGFPASQLVDVPSDLLLLVTPAGRAQQGVTAELMGHRRVDLTLNTYTQVMPNASQEAVRVIADELFTIVHTPERGVALTH